MVPVKAARTSDEPTWMKSWSAAFDVSRSSTEAASDPVATLQRMRLVIASIILILAVGIAIELLVFAPIERRVLRNRGLLVDR